MIYSLEGTPGTGKTLFLVQKIIPDFLRVQSSTGELTPVHIYHNIEGLKPEFILALLNLPCSILPYFHRIGERVDEDGNIVEDKRYLQYFYYNPDTIEFYQDRDDKGKIVWKPKEDTAEYLPLNSVVILDEVQNIFGARDFAEHFSKACIKYLTRHRHYGHTIWWASQNVEQVDVTFRRNTQYVWFLESLENFGFAGGGGAFKISKYEGWLAGNKTNIMPYATEKVQKKKQFFNCYNSHVSGKVKEVRYKTNILLANKPLMVTLIIIAVALVLAVVNGNPFFGSKKVGTQKNVPPSTSKGFSPDVGGEDGPKKTEEKHEVNSSCVTQTYVYKGKQYLVIDGESVEPMEGANYVKCN